MKSLILYSSFNDSPGAYPLVINKSGVFTELFIRVEVFDGDIAEALDKAKPRQDEVVLNTIKLLS